MADPKYANLPGIDTESKDVYECGDLPEDDQNVSAEEMGSTSVELVDTKGSFDKFSGKYVSGVGKDFSGRLQHGKLTGYDVGGFGLASLGDRETVFQKFNRLKIEVAELVNDVDKIKAAQPAEASVLGMAEQVRYLQTQLDEVEIEENSQKTLTDNLNVDKILSNLQGPSAKDSKSKVDNGVYQLYLKPGQQDREKLRASALEQRLARLEKILGTRSSNLNVLTSHAKSGTLQESVQIMESKLSLLDSEQLPQVDSRLQAILTKVNEINKTQKSTSSDEQSVSNKKVSELYETVQKWEGVRGALPLIVERLQALDTLHVKACDFVSTLNHLESVQSKITAQLDSNNTTHKKLDEMLRQNLTAVQSNIEQLNKRISAIVGK